MSRVQKLLNFTLVGQEDVEYFALIGVTDWWSQKIECSSQMYDLHGIGLA